MPTNKHRTEPVLGDLEGGASIHVERDISTLLSEKKPESHVSDTNLFRFGPNEEKLAEYFFRTAGDFGNVGVITNQRLIVVTKEMAESYPLGKINSVKIGYSRSLTIMVFGILIALIGLVGWGVISYLTRDVGLVSEMPSQVAIAIQLGPYVCLFLILIGMYYIYYGWKGQTVLIVSHMGGEKTCQVMGKDPELLIFVETLTHQI